MKNLWRGFKLDKNSINKILRNLENNDVCIAGDGSVRDQLGSFAMCFALKNTDKPFFTVTGPVDGHRHHMKALRAEATHSLASIALISRIVPFIRCSEIEMPIYTDCKTLINRVETNNINSPSLVMTDHIDLIYQIRELLSTTNVKFVFEYAKTIKDDSFDMVTPPEKLVQLMHIRAYGHFCNKEAIIPRQYSDYMPGSIISIMANNKPVVSDVGMTLQSMERIRVRDEYIEEKFGVANADISNIDSYTLGRVFLKNPKRHSICTKIIHRELNTMSVNEKWNGSSDKCPVCLVEREDWRHPLVCQNPDLIRVREHYINEFEIQLEYFKTHPPLANYIINFLRNLHVQEKPDPPQIMDQRYLVEFYAAFQNQTKLGWNNFCRGIVSRHWRFLQHCYLLDQKNRDQHAVDKWTRMFIKSILEIYRLAWKERCEILHQENEFTYEQRQRDRVWKFCLYLWQNIEKVPKRDRHFLWKHQSFFTRGNIVSVLNWEKRMHIAQMVFEDTNESDIRKYLVEYPENDNREKRKRDKTGDAITYENARMKQHRLNDFFEIGKQVHENTVRTIRKRPRQYKTQTDLNIHFKRPKISTNTCDDDIMNIYDENMSGTTNDYTQNEAVGRFKREREHSPPINATHTTLEHVKVDSSKRLKLTTLVVDPYTFCHPNFIGSHVSFH